MIIHLNSPVNNASLQVGDVAYFVIGGFDPQIIGAITEINASSIRVDSNSSVPNDVFIMFAKNSECNTGGIKGYYAEPKMQNTSDNYAELFAVSSEISLSSK